MGRNRNGRAKGMTAAKASESVLARKLAAGSGTQRAARSLLRVLRLAVARTAADEVGAPAAVIGATEYRGALDELSENLPETGMPVLLEGDDGRLGGAIVDGQLVSALVQQLTTGQILAPWPDSRRFTPTDAALIAPFLDGILARLVDLVEQADDRDCVAGLRCAGMAEDPGGLLLALEDGAFRVLELSLDIGGGARQGGLVLVLSEPAGGAESGTAPPPHPRGMERNFGAIRAELTAVIERLRLPLAQLARMQPGELLPLARGRLNQTELVALDGRVIATGKLGQAGGLRAIRLRLTPRGEAVAPPDLPARFVKHPGPDEAEPQAPAPAETGPAPAPAPQEPEDEDGYHERLSRMTPDEALAEISSLAGLPEADSAPAKTGTDDAS